MGYAANPAVLTSGRAISFVPLLTALLTLGGCRKAAPEVTTDARVEASAPVKLGFAGCAAVSKTASGDLACELDASRSLRFAPVPGGLSVVVEPGARPLLVDGDAGASGPVTMNVPVPATALRVRTHAGGVFTLQLVDAPQDSWLTAARAARAKGDLAGARAALGGHEGDARAESLLARIVLAEGRADDAFPIFTRAIAAHRAAGRIGEASDDAFALAFALHQRSHRYEQARAVLDTAAPLLVDYPEGAAREPYYRGILAAETGNRRTAATLLREAEQRARALGLTKLERNARAARALELAALGRAREARALLLELRADPAVVGCERVEIENDLGSLPFENDARERELARASLAAAASTPGCADAYLAGFVLANLARVALDEGRTLEARQRLDEATRRVKEPRGTERLAWLDLEGRIALAERRPQEALARFVEERRLAAASLLVEAEWSAEVGAAEAEDALGHADVAVRSLERADALLERASLLVPLGEGRGSFLGMRDRSARLAVDLLVRRGRLEDAARVARRSRARLLSGVARARRIELMSPEARAAWERAVATYRDARATLDRESSSDWTLPAADLVRAAETRRARERDAREALEAAIGEVARASGDGGMPDVELPRGHLEVLVHPTLRGWVALLRDTSRTTAVPLADPRDESAGRVLVDGVAGRLAGVTRVHVLAYGAYRTLEVHALASASTGGAPLADLVEIDYPVGLGPVAPRPARAGALVIGDPTEDLPLARREAEEAASALRARGIPVVARLGASASPRDVLPRLPDVDVLHWAGHGRYGASEGLESALPLADGARLTVTDVLALPGAPRRVVLTACEAGRSDGELEGLGIAQAFLVAGADEVLAPTRPVPDELAAAVARELVAPSDAAPPHDLAGTLHRVLPRVRASASAADWSAFRVLAR